MKIPFNNNENVNLIFAIYLKLDICFQLHMGTFNEFCEILKMDLLSSPEYSGIF